MKLWLMISENKMHYSLLIAAISLLCLFYLTGSSNPAIKWTLVLNFSVATFLAFYKLKWAKYCFYIAASVSIVVGVYVVCSLAIMAPYIMLASMQVELLAINMSFALFYYAIATLAGLFSHSQAGSSKRLMIYATAAFIALGSYWLTSLLTRFLSDTLHYLPTSKYLYENIGSNIELENPFSIWIISWPTSLFEFICAAVISFLLTLPFLKRWVGRYTIRATLVLPSLVTFIIFIQLVSNTINNKGGLRTPFFEDWNFALQSLINISLGIILGAFITIMLRKSIRYSSL